MSTLHLTVDLSKITRNARKALAICRSHGMGVMGVTKGVCGDPKIAKAMLAGGIDCIGDARLDNIVKLREGGVIAAPLTLIRSPAPSEVPDCAAHADASLHGDLRVLRMLAKEAARAGKTHRVVPMADLDTGREGFAPAELPEVLREVQGMGGLAIGGLGLYLDFRSEDGYVVDKQREFVALARRLEAECGATFPVLSGGSTNVFRRVLKGMVVPGITQLRIGTSILLGIASSLGPIVVPELDQDTFVLDAVLIEVKRRGDRTVGLLSLGKLDAVKEQLFPIAEGVGILDMTNDHTVVDLTGLPAPPAVGDTVSFHLGYSSLNRLMASPYMDIEYQ